MALLDLPDRGEIPGQVGRPRSGRLDDPRERQDPEPDGLGIDDGSVALDDAARLQALDPLVHGRPADADLAAELGIRFAAVRLEDLQDPDVGRVESLTRHPKVPLR
jgi:hypothetical protein